MSKKINLAKLEDEFSSIVHAGQKIILAEQAYITNRVMTEYPDDLQYNGDGPAYMIEYKADGFKSDGTPVTVTWHFKVMREDVSEEESAEVEGAYSYDTPEDCYDWQHATYVEFEATSQQAAAARLGSSRSAKKAASSRANLPRKVSPYEEYLHPWTDDDDKIWWAVAAWRAAEGQYYRPLTPAERRVSGAGMYGYSSRNIHDMGKYTRHNALRRAKMLFGPKE